MVEKSACNMPSYFGAHKIGAIFMGAYKNSATLAHGGDPMRDVTFLCTPSWRFGQYDLEAGGFAPLDAWVSDYEAASGIEVDRDRFRWWMVFNTLWWGVTCMRLSSTFREGSVRTLERAVIGRRVSEVEVDLLLQLEALLDVSPQDFHHVPFQLTQACGDVTFTELNDAVREWNKTAVIPTASGHAAFEAKVANNALGMLGRAQAFGAQHQQREQTRLNTLGLNTEDWCNRLRNGSMAGFAEGEWNALRSRSLERLEIDQPRYAGVAAAYAAWGVDAG